MIKRAACRCAGAPMARAEARNRRCRDERERTRDLDVFAGCSRGFPDCGTYVRSGLQKMLIREPAVMGPQFHFVRAKKGDGCLVMFDGALVMFGSVLKMLLRSQGVMGFEMWRGF